jgi:carboxymethylenebutenolidase
MAALPHEGEYSVMYRTFPIPVGSSYRRGYLTRPDKAGRFPVVVLIPDVDGLNAHEKNLARRLARRGIAVASVHPFESATGSSLRAYAELDDREVVRILDETHEFLASDDIDWAHADRVGVLGLDIGGRFALIQAAHRPWVAAAAAVYTPLTGDEDRRFPVADMLEHLAPPVLGLYGAADELIAGESVDEAQRRNAGGSWLLYENAGHGFMNESHPGYDVAAAEDAVARLVAFFQTHLPAPEVLVVG